MFTINNTEVKDVILNNTEMRYILLKTTAPVSETYVWYKTYTLTITNSDGITVTATRISSPVAGAELGVLNSGATIYANDEINFTCSVSSGYSFKSWYISGVSYTQSTNITFFVHSNITSTANATVTATKSWKIVYSGSYKTTQNTSTSAKTYDISISVQSYTNTRVTGSLLDSTDKVLGTFTEKELTTSSYVNISYSGKAQMIKYTGTKLTATLQKPTLLAKAPYFEITKVEQYY